MASIPITKRSEAAISAGALGCLTSGSGPSIPALCDNTSPLIAEECGEAMRRVMIQHRMDMISYISGINREGHQILKGREVLFDLDPTHQVSGT